MSDTPETDKYCGEDLWIGEPALVSSDFARKLERERNEAREALDNETQFHHRTHGELVKAQCALMDARAALQRLADCDWVITPHDRMDAVRKIARDALEAAK